MRLLLPLCFLILTIASCAPDPKKILDADAPLIDSVTIDRHLAELASDKYGGRLPFSEGETLTLDYLETELQALGLTPGNGKSYRQEVPMIEIAGTPVEIIGLNTISGTLLFNLGSDYITYSDKAQEDNAVSKSDLVFAGFGVVAPEYGWNDYEGLDVKGKTVVVMVNDPGYYTEDPRLFKGKEMTYYGRYDYKFAEAARQGAAACLVIHETGAAGYPWFVVESSWSGTRLTLEDDGSPKLDLAGWITIGAAKKLFAATRPDIGGWFALATKPDFKAIPLNARLSTQVQNELRRDKSHNIIATLPGTTRPEEYVVYTAHWDHIGVGPAVNGDSIYNGALDNASGTAQLLAIAEAYSKLPEPPARTVVFLFVTAEEQGLWGSDYYVRNPIFPLAKTVANINIDGINPIGPAKDLTITGRGHSEMDDLAAKEAKAQGRYVQADPEPEKGYFYRSDHFNFAKAGIPVLYAAGGYDHATLGRDYAKKKQAEFVATRYHQPSDQYSSGDWPLGGAMQDGELLFKLGLGLANGEGWPKWDKASEFYKER